MKKLIVCLGYDLKRDGSISSLLKNRIIDSVNLCRKNPNSTLILMGGFSYRDTRKKSLSQAATMRQYIEKSFDDIVKNTKILIEENILDKDLGENLKKMAQFRNVIVHEYIKIDPEIIFSILKKNLPDISKFSNLIIKKFILR